MPKDPMLFYPYNYCLNCKTNSIELYNWHNYAQKYQKLLDQYHLNGTIPDTFDKYGVYTMRCSKCGKEYKIRWTEDGVPIPVVGDDYQLIFSEKFREDSIAGRPNIIQNIYEEKMKDAKVSY